MWSWWYFVRLKLFPAESKTKCVQDTSFWAVHDHCVNLQVFHVPSPTSCALIAVYWASPGDIAYTTKRTNNTPTTVFPQWFFLQRSELCANFYQRPTSAYVYPYSCEALRIALLPLYTRVYTHVQGTYSRNFPAQLL